MVRNVRLNVGVIRQVNTDRHRRVAAGTTIVGNYARNRKSNAPMVFLKSNFGITIPKLHGNPVLLARI